MTNKKKIDEIVEVADEILNQWERDFIESMSENSDPENLSKAQQDKLEQIYQKACDSGL